jgi:hypothetical protein
MELEHILQAIHDLENGLVNYNNGQTYCFLYDNKWYPIHATINRARLIANVNAEYNLHRCVSELHNLLDVVIINQIEIENNNLVHLGTEEKFELITNLADKIKELSN